jgi:uncharacterized membrane protein YoaK (UPF0700 family)
MPIDYLRGLTGRSRTHLADRHLAYYLTFTAGAVNAGGFLAIGHFTSHMSGIVSLMAEHTAVGELRTAAGGALAVFLFTSGAAVSAWLVSWGRRQDRESMYALPLLLEGVLLLVFGLWGGTLAERPAIFVPLTIGLLCFLMGLQNAMVTKLSQAEIRTTHVTGMITDVGIEIGKLVYWNRRAELNPRGWVRADRDRLRRLTLLVTTFFLGGVAGAFGFRHLGFVSAVPLALLLFVLAGLPVLDDVRRRPGQA